MNLNIFTNQETLSLTPRTEVGLVREVIDELAKELGWSKATIQLASKRNTAKRGQLMVNIVEVDTKKKGLYNEQTNPKGLQFKRFNIGTEISNMIRDEEVPWSAVLDLMIVEHTNLPKKSEPNPKPYALAVRPSTYDAVEDTKGLEKSAIDSTTTSEFSWEDDAEKSAKDTVQAILKFS